MTDAGSATIPHGYVLVRTTPMFDRDTVPDGLLRAHRVAAGVWGRLVVRAGTVRFVFEDDPGAPIALGAGDSVVIPPGRLHHVELPEPAAFVVEFHRAPQGGEGEGRRE